MKLEVLQLALSIQVFQMMELSRNVALHHLMEQLPQFQLLLVKSLIAKLCHVSAKDVFTSKNSKILIKNIMKAIKTIISVALIM